MNKENRKAILLDFKNLENDAIVNSWHIMDIDLWPIIKDTLFFDVIKPPGRLAGFKIAIRNFLFTINYNNKTIPAFKNPVNAVFIASDTTRIVKEGNLYNKYFDPMMDYLETKDKQSCLVEFSKLKGTDYYKDYRLIDGLQYLKKPSETFKIKELRQLLNFDVIIKTLCEKYGLKYNYILEKIKIKANTTLMWRDYFDGLFQTNTPSFVGVLCYYCEPSYGALLAAKKKNIPTIDMQHGGQGSGHFAYTYNTNSAKLNLLPNYFWVWDTASANHLNSWLPENRILQGGNPSLKKDEGLALKSKLPDNAHLILYTLQTTIKPLVPLFLIDAIKSSSKEYLWWFRLHPRMKTEEKKELMQVLKENNIYDKINFMEANKLSLSTILGAATVHISSYSGSLIEAALLNVPLNVTFTEIGREYFSDLIDQKQLHYYNPEVNNDFLNLINESISVNVQNNNDDVTNYQAILDSLMVKKKN